MLKIHLMRIVSVFRKVKIKKSKTIYICLLYNENEVQYQDLGVTVGTEK